MDEAYESSLFEMEDEHWWYRGRRRVVGELVRQVELPAAPRLLDVGCGTGRNLVELQRLGDAVGVEPSAAAVAVARARGLPVTESGAESLGFGDGTFDLVTALDVIEHIEDDRTALRELRRVTSPTGALVVTVPAYQWLWSSHDDMNLHKRRYGRPALLQALAEAGWRVVRATYFNSLLLLPIAAHRRLQRIIGDSTSEANDFTRTPSALNPVLEAPFRLEARMIARGIDLPFGVSLAAIAQPGRANTETKSRPRRRSGSSRSSQPPRPA
jgi:SAM-dependent methyltransferase